MNQKINEQINKEIAEKGVDVTGARAFTQEEQQQLNNLNAQIQQLNLQIISLAKQKGMILRNRIIDKKKYCEYRKTRRKEIEKELKEKAKEEKNKTNKS